MSTFRHLFTRHLLLANTLTCGLQGATGDFLEQLLTGKLKEEGWNTHQTVVMCGAKFLIGPPMHLFYHVLDGIKFRGNRQQVVWKKLFFDTLTNPCVSLYLVTKFVPTKNATAIQKSATILEGSNLQVAFHDYKQKFFDYIKIDFIFWPCGQFLNFYFVPHHYRILFVNFLAIIDVTLLSFIRKRQLKEEEKALL